MPGGSGISLSCLVSGSFGALGLGLGSLYPRFLECLFILRLPQCIAGSEIFLEVYTFSYSDICFVIIHLMLLGMFDVICWNNFYLVHLVVC